MDIEASTRRSLEWERLKEFLAEESCCPWSRELCLSLEVSVVPAVVEELLGQTKEALDILSAGFGLSQEGLPELRPSLARLRTGSQLSPHELVDILRLLQLSKRTRAQLSQLNVDDFPCLSLFPPKIFALADLSDAINCIVDEHGNIKDDASPTLRGLRKNIHRLTERTQKELLHLINSSNVSKALQEPLYTQRNGRYVLPVQASMRGSVQGIVHDSSASGMTVYVEPFSVVELTNAVKLNESEIEREIEKILSRISAEISTHIDELDSSYEALSEIDHIAARARLARKYDGIKPAITHNGSVSLQQAKHPLLILHNRSGASQVVANDIILNEQCRTLVITGPNTGGKTVYLKTAGLLSLMAQAGLLLPVAPGSATTIFSHVFADIGDEQSLEQSLSTFSSHMIKLVEIVNRSNEKTLVLLDEIGAGTDPREGAVLARVILEHLNHCNSSTISATHYSELKSLAYTTGGFANGSFEFDDVQLTPTYKLKMGIPGSSKAITIASRLGLRKTLVESAESLLATDQTDIQTSIEQFENRLKQLDKSEEQLKEQQEANRQWQDALNQQEERLESERNRLRSGVRDRMEEEFGQAKELIRSLIAELQRSPSLSKAQKTQKDMEVLRNELGWLTREEAEQAAKELRLGQQVLVASLQQVAVIESLPEQGKSGPDALATVRLGAMKIKVPVTELQADTSRQGQKRPTLKGAKSKSSAASDKVTVSRSELDVFVRTSQNTLDLRGQRVEPALALVERFIDNAFGDHLSPLMIIHGHGTGQLKSAVRRFLDEAPYKISWRPGDPHEGGDGVSIVNL